MNLVHNNEKVIALFAESREFGTIHTIFNGTQAECDAEILRLKLTPLPLPPPLRLPRPKPPINESTTPS
jgi:hypothetical protein